MISLNGKKRPLGIPAMHDRAEQALDLLGLDPVSESTADYHSYGFRKSRSAQDAMSAVYNALRRKGSADWILEADIKGCFDLIRQANIANKRNFRITSDSTRVGCAHLLT